MVKKYAKSSKGKRPVGSEASASQLVADAQRLAEAATPFQNAEYVPAFASYRPVGSSGTEIYSGYIHEDYLAELRGTRRADLFDKIRRSDAQAKMCLSAVKNPIRQANWEIVLGANADEVPEAEQHREFIEHVLFRDMDQPWKKTLNEILTFIDFGHSVFEVTHKVVIDHPKFGSYNGIRSLGWRSQRTIEKFNVNPATGQLVSVTQQANGDVNKYVDIPACYLLVFNTDKEGSNYEGISLLRPCYGPWFRKNTYLKLNAIGIEKFAVPTPIAKIPPNKYDSKEYGRLIQALEIYTTHQANYLAIPNGWEVVLTTNTYDPQKVETSIDNEDKRMVKSFLANFLELGMNGTGAFALSNDLSDFFLSGLDFMADEVCGPINTDLIPNLIKMNFGPQASYPVIKASGISDKVGQEFADILTKLGAGNFLTPSDEDEDYVRERYNLPKRDMTTARVVQKPAVPGAAPAAPVDAPEEPEDIFETQTLSERILKAAQVKTKARTK